MFAFSLAHWRDWGNFSCFQPSDSLLRELHLVAMALIIREVVNLETKNIIIGQLCNDAR